MTGTSPIAPYRVVHMVERMSRHLGRFAAFFTAVVRLHMLADGALARRRDGGGATDELEALAAHGRDFASTASKARGVLARFVLAAHGRRFGAPFPPVALKVMRAHGGALIVVTPGVRGGRPDYDPGAAAVSVSAGGVPGEAPLGLIDLDGLARHGRLVEAGPGAFDEMEAFSAAADLDGLTDVEGLCRLIDLL